MPASSSQYAPVPSTPSPPSLSLSNPQTWDSLRKSAKQLENELDTKLASFGRLASAPASTYGESSSDAQAEAVELELDGLLKKLSSTIESLSALLTPSSPPSSYHIIQRHRDLLFENQREFKKTKANIASAREHAELLSSVQHDISTHRNMIASGPDYYLTERGKVDSSHRMLDDTIEQAYAVREDVGQQRLTLTGVQRKMVDVAALFPQLTNLMKRIRLRRQRDTIILACLTSFCIILLMYWRR